MKEIYGNLWDQEGIKVITTNGYVKNNGEAVMGRGCALEAAQRYPNLPRLLGDHLKIAGNHVRVLYPKDLRNIIYEIITFPVKNEWNQQADIFLIKRSCEELSFLCKNLGFDKVVLPRPGCGNGGLDWLDVKKVIEPLLDNRFSVITFKP